MKKVVYCVMMKRMDTDKDGEGELISIHKSVTGARSFAEQAKTNLIQWLKKNKVKMKLTLIMFFLCKKKNFQIKIRQEPYKIGGRTKYEKA